MKDPHPYVRDTTAWTIGRVFEFQHDAGNTDVPELITRETLPQVAQVSGHTVASLQWLAWMVVLMQQDSARYGVWTQCCWSVQQSTLDRFRFLATEAAGG